MSLLIDRDPLRIRDDICCRCIIDEDVNRLVLQKDLRYDLGFVVLCIPDRQLSDSCSGDDHLCVQTTPILLGKTLFKELAG